MAELDNDNVVNNIPSNRLIYGLPILNNFNDVPIILTNKAYATLIVKKYKDIENNNIESRCIICQEDYNDEDDICLLPCNHGYHESCIATWLLNYNYKCPICRSETGEYTANI
jgi:hypothetical protein